MRLDATKSETKGILGFVFIYYGFAQKLFFLVFFLVINIIVMK